MDRSSTQVTTGGEEVISPLVRNQSALLADLKSPFPFVRNSSSNLQIPFMMRNYSRTYMDSSYPNDAGDYSLSPDLVMSHSPSVMQYGYGFQPFQADAYILLRLS